MDKIRTDDILVVEGKYDRIRLSALVDGIILETDGFAVFSDEERKQLLKTLAKDRRIILLTDSDAAGFRIRHYIASFLPADKVKHALIPDVYGKEKRKATPSKEGKLGVEGMDSAVLLDVLQKAGLNRTEDEERPDPVTTADLFTWGLTGTQESSKRRRELLKKLGYPARTGIPLMLTIVNATMTKKSFAKIAETL